MSNQRPMCNRADCFQNKCGALCELLTSQPSHPCPFYKTKEQAAAGKMNSHKRLVSMGRYDLIEKYEHNNQRSGW